MTSNKTFLWTNCHLTPRDFRNQRRALLWLLVWTATWFTAAVAIRKEWISGGLPSYAAVVIPTVIGVTMILSYWRFVKEADELLRKIQLDALAIGFGTGIVAAITYRLLTLIGALEGATAADLAAVMIIAYAVGVVVGTTRYA